MSDIWAHVARNRDSEGWNAHSFKVIPGVVQRKERRIN